MKISFIFAWYDFWIGLFWDKKKKWLYFLPIPMFGLIFKFKCKHKWKFIFPNSYECIKCEEEFKFSYRDWEMTYPSELEMEVLNKTYKRLLSDKPTRF